MKKLLCIISVSVLLSACAQIFGEPLDPKVATRLEKIDAQTKRVCAAPHVDNSVYVESALTDNLFSGFFNNLFGSTPSDSGIDDAIATLSIDDRRSYDECVRDYVETARTNAGIR